MCLGTGIRTGFACISQTHNGLGVFVPILSVHDAILVFLGLTSRELECAALALGVVTLGVIVGTEVLAVLQVLQYKDFEYLAIGCTLGLSRLYKAVDTGGVDLSHTFVGTTVQILAL